MNGKKGLMDRWLDEGHGRLSTGTGWKLVARRSDTRARARTGGDCTKALHWGMVRESCEVGCIYSLALDLG